MEPSISKAKEILVSIATIPASLEQLTQRDFLKAYGGFDEYAVWIFMNLGNLSKYWYEDKHGVFHIRKEFRDDVKEHIFN